MRTAKKIEGIKCAKCGAADKQRRAGFNRSGTQRCVCNYCAYKYTLNPKANAYPEEVREQAIKIYYSGVSGNGVGKIFNMHHSNVVSWIKKTGNGVDKSKNGI